MKTRIISGAVLIIIVAGILSLGTLVNSIFITAFIALLAAMAVYELLHNAAGIKSKTALSGACIYAFLSVVALNGVYKLNFPDYIVADLDMQDSYTFKARVLNTLILSVLYFIFAAAVTLKKHSFFDSARIVTLCAMPIPIGFAFSTLGIILNHNNGIYYLLMLLNFSSICDMGAYFTGVTIGKHKLCPEISPKKTIEGAVGGIVLSVIVTLILVFAFSFKEKLIVTLLLTVPFCILSMIGDLFASIIKRTAGIKDYGKIIPGHGGILDRFDSIIMIAPLFYIFIAIGVI